MKRIVLIKRLQEMNCVLIRQGRRHDWYQNSETIVVINQNLSSVAATLVVAFNQGQACSYNSMSNFD
jgi:hypothetical protein